MGYYTDTLTKIRAAIDDILATGQSISDDGNMLTRADLAKLERMEERYAAKSAQETRAAAGRGRNRIRYVVPK